MQLYGKKEPSSQIVDLTIKGRGNTSFDVAKFGYKIKLSKKSSLLGMPEDKEWDLIANFRDKSMLQNYITYQLAGILDDEYYPKCQFIELYLNRQYRGVFLLVEHVKVSEKRVNISKENSSFLFEKTTDSSKDGTMFKSSLGYIFKFCQPKKPDTHSKKLLEDHINDFESFLKSKNVNNLDSIKKWIDVEDFIRYFWIQEFTKNIDGHRRSIYLTWEKSNNKNNPIKMGPVWDFDMGYGNSGNEKNIPEQWYIRYYGWNQYLFKNKEYKQLVNEYWKKNRALFVATLDSIDAMSEKLLPVTSNEFKRWPILENDTDAQMIRKYNSYQEVIDTLKSWIETRIQWIDENL